VRVWRITRQRYASLDGEGARMNGGRWNSEGIPVVYASSTLSLAALEYLVHIDVEDVPHDLCALKIAVPDDAAIEDVELPGLPADWNRVEDHPACTSRGDDWARRGAALALRVPSALIPAEHNLLLNPRHPDMQRVRIVSFETFSFDPRLLG
jgi:RES domain-containing protein